MGCNCQDKPVWEVVAELSAVESNSRLPLHVRNIARVAREHLERLSAAAKFAGET